MTKLTVKPYIPFTSTLTPGDFKAAISDGELRFPVQIARAFTSRGLLFSDELQHYLKDRVKDIAHELSWTEAEVQLANRKLHQAISLHYDQTKHHTQADSESEQAHKSKQTHS